MSELSPAAQAVLDAAHFVYWAHDEVHVADPAVIAAAALRSVADQFFTDWDGMCCAEHLLAIATELEGRWFSNSPRTLTTPPC